MTKSHPRFDVVIAVTYYTPYVSGLTEVARVEAEGLAARGHRVLVVTNQHDNTLPRSEVINNVTVVRCPVWLRAGRGIASPTFVSTCLRHARRIGALHLHAPMLEAGLIARLARPHTHVVVTHHIDLWLPPSPLARASVAVANHATRSAIRAADTVIVNSQDQANGSLFRRDLDSAHLVPIPAPCIHRGDGRPTYRETAGPHYGFLGRIVPDKGLGYLLDAFHQVEDPDARLVLGGEAEHVAGGGMLGELQDKLRRDPRVRTVGMLSGSALDDFYESIDVFTLPSVAESFGIAQAEALMLGIPSITSDLPGGRHPVTHTGLGMLVQPRDVHGLTKALRQAPTRFTSAQRTRAAQVAREDFGVARFLVDSARVLQLPTLAVGQEESRSAEPAA